MKVTEIELLDDEGTRVLLGGITDYGLRVAFHVVLTSDRGVEMAQAARRGELAAVHIPHPDVHLT